MTSAQAEQHLTDLAEQFAHWRQQRTSSFSPFPQTLWEHAVALTVLLPLAQVAKQLRVRGTDLKKRCMAQQVAPAADGTPATLHFVKLPAPPAWLRPTPTPRWNSNARMARACGCSTTNHIPRWPS